MKSNITDIWMEDITTRLVLLVEDLLNRGICSIDSKGALTFSPQARAEYSRYYFLLEHLRCEAPNEYRAMKESYRKLFCKGA